MLAVYTFVFSVVFQAKWETPVGGKTQFGLILFLGLVLFNIFSECLCRAPALILNHVAYVKKVVFPLEILPWVLLNAALFNAAISFLVLLVGCFLFLGHLPYTAFLFPIMLIPLVLLTMGCSLFLASTGVFVRDLQQLTGILITMLMFLTPLFYPVTALPENFRMALRYSPLAIIIEESRNMFFFGVVPSISTWLWLTAGAWLIVWLGHIWFMKTKKGFADVL